jgi:hypothetical protein
MPDGIPAAGTRRNEVQMAAGSTAIGMPNPLLIAEDVEGCLAAVHDMQLEALLDCPALSAAICRVGEQAKIEPHQYSAFGSFVDLPPEKRRQAPIETRS